VGGDRGEVRRGQVSVSESEETAEWAWQSCVEALARIRRFSDAAEDTESTLTVGILMLEPAPVWGGVTPKSAFIQCLCGRPERRRLLLQRGQAGPDRNLSRVIARARPCTHHFVGGVTAIPAGSKTSTVECRLEISF